MWGGNRRSGGNAAMGVSAGGGGVLKAGCGEGDHMLCGAEGLAVAVGVGDAGVVDFSEVAAEDGLDDVDVTEGDI